MKTTEAKCSCTLAGLLLTGVSSLVAGNNLTAGIDLAGISFSMRTDLFWVEQNPAREQMSLGCCRGIARHSVSNMSPITQEKGRRSRISDMHWLIQLCTIFLDDIMQHPLHHTSPTNQLPMMLLHLMPTASNITLLPCMQAWSDEWQN